MTVLKQVLAEAKASVYGGKKFEQRIADGGFSIRVQRTDTWNSYTPRIAIHVWHQEDGAKKCRLLKKAEWLKLIA